MGNSPHGPMGMRERAGKGIRGTIALLAFRSMSNGFILRQCNPSVMGYGFRQREKGSYLNFRIFGELIEKAFNGSSFFS
jgi:hypothetical protein